MKRTQSWLPGIFNDFFGNEWVTKANVTAPAINIYETEEAYDVEIAAPGMTKEDFKIRIDEDNQLIVSMEKRQEEKEGRKEGRYLRREFSYTQFQQTMILPDDVEKDKIEAKVEHGVLNITIPKRQETQEPKSERQIEIK